jgi:TonB family protein
MQKYIAEVVSRIQRVKQYPKDAIFNEQEGLVEVLIEIAPDGKINRSQITKSTPYQSLNAAAIQAVEKLGILPPLPQASESKPVKSPIQLRIPIHFQLR